MNCIISIYHILINLFILSFQYISCKIYNIFIYNIASKGNSIQSQATVMINLGLKVILVVVRMLLFIWCRKEPMFYASKEWLGQFTYFFTSKGNK